MTYSPGGMADAAEDMMYGMRPCASGGGSSSAPLPTTCPSLMYSSSTIGLAEMDGSGYTTKNMASSEPCSAFTMGDRVGVMRPPWYWNGSLGSRSLALGCSDRISEMFDMVTPLGAENSNSFRAAPTLPASRSITAVSSVYLPAGTVKSSL